MIGLGTIVQQVRQQRNAMHAVSQSLDVGNLNRGQRGDRLKTACNLKRRLFTNNHAV